MKAFTIYPKSEIDLRRLLSKLQHVGQMNCDFPTFARIYEEWHKTAFPGVAVSTAGINMRDDWFVDFVNYLAKRDI